MIVLVWPQCSAVDFVVMSWLVHGSRSTRKVIEIEIKSRACRDLAVASKRTLDEHGFTSLFSLIPALRIKHLTQTVTIGHLCAMTISVTIKIHITE